MGASVVWFKGPRYENPRDGAQTWIGAWAAARAGYVQKRRRNVHNPQRLHCQG